MKSNNTDQMNQNANMQQNAQQNQNPSQAGQNFGQNPYYANNLNAQNQNTHYANQNPYYNQSYGQSVPHSHTLTSWLGQTSSDRFIRGLVIGAAATYILTNEKAQKAIIKTGMKLYGAVAGGVEEIKEKIMDAKAELEDGEE